ncbi:hypothetical protein V6Z11_A11G223900 [Gossypium hirsutum]
MKFFTNYSAVKVFVLKILFVAIWPDPLPVRTMEKLNLFKFLCFRLRIALARSTIWQGT